MTVAAVVGGWDCLSLGVWGFSVTVADDCRHSCLVAGVVAEVCLFEPWLCCFGFASVEFGH